MFILLKHKIKYPANQTKLFAPAYILRINHREDGYTLTEAGVLRTSMILPLMTKLSSGVR